MLLLVSSHPLLDREEGSLASLLYHKEHLLQLDHKAYVQRNNNSQHLNLEHQHLHEQLLELHLSELLPHFRG